MGENTLLNHCINLLITLLPAAVNNQVFICFAFCTGQKSPPINNRNNPSQHLPDVPTGVALLPRSPCGIHVLWNPVRYTISLLTYSCTV